jgi:hypothetical protein
VKEQIYEKPDIKKPIKKEPPAKNHSESFGFERNRIIFAAIAPFPSDNCYITI